MRRWLVLMLLVSVVFSLSACVVHERREAQREGVYHNENRDLVGRIDNQQARIDQGISSGQLTRHEARMLQDNLNYIRGEYSRLTADGRLTPHEYDRLNRLLEQNNEMIYREKHNDIRRLY